MSVRVMRLWRSLALTALVSGAIVLTLLSPLVLNYFAERPLDWPKLGNVGEAYGAASAILSGLALCGVAISLIVQRRQAHVAMMYSVRQRQFELAKMSIDDPSLLYAVEPFYAPRPDIRLHIMVNLWVTHWFMCWDLGEVDDAAISVMMSYVFQGEVGRDWWRENRSWWLGRGAAERRYSRLIESAYQHAASSGTPPIPPPDDTPVSEVKRVKGNERRLLLPVALGAAVIGAVAGYELRRRRSSPGISSSR